MKRKIWQAFVVAGLLLFLSRTAVQRDLQASAFQEKIEQCLKAGELPVVVLSQESGEYESIGKSALWAAEYAAAQVNKNGGVNGCNVRIVSENTGSDDSKALSLYQGASRTASAVLGPVDAPVMEKLVEAYKKVNPNAEIEQQTTDSTTGITSAIDGKCDIGMASRDLKEEETGVKATKIALDGIAVIVNNDNPTDEISSDMVKQIFTGEVTKWQDVK